MTQQLLTDAALLRIRSEYLEMPGLRLTMAQAQRLWNLDGSSCHVLLEALIAARFLWRTSDGAFVRRDCNSPVQWSSAEVSHDACCEPERREASAADWLQGITG